ncbi:MAG: lipid A deacylase LpxR family protein [Alphaproteobacteria bacterium]
MGRRIGRRTQWVQAFAALFGVAALGMPGSSEAEVGLGFVIENDFFGVPRGDISDRYYSNGFVFTYRRSGEDASGFSTRLVDRLFGADETAHTLEAFGIGQSFFTPEDLTVADPQPQDHPYAGWLRLTYDLAVHDGHTIDSAQISLGVVGPLAAGRQLQRFWHDMIQDVDPQGWDNQLGNEPVLQAIWQRKWKPYTLFTGARLGDIRFGGDIRPVTDVNLGNAFVNGGVGGEIRIGNDLEGTFGAPRLGPAAPFSGFSQSTEDGLNWSIFAGASARVVGRNLFVEGNTFRDSLGQDARLFVNDVSAGVSLQLGHAELAYSFVTRSEEFNRQRGRHYFGLIGLTTSF